MKDEESAETHECACEGDLGWRVARGRALEEGTHLCSPEYCSLSHFFLPPSLCGMRPDRVRVSLHQVHLSVDAHQ